MSLHPKDRETRLATTGDMAATSGERPWDINSLETSLVATVIAVIMIADTTD
jgi:hypothetical protein